MSLPDTHLVCQAMAENSHDVSAVDDMPASDESSHSSARCEEWTFSWWSSKGDLAGHAVHRLVGSSRVWYCWGLWRRGEPLIHIAEFDISRRPNPMIAKASSLWAEFTCDAPFEQWTLGNETYAVELDDPDEALGRAYGRAVPIASDLEWYATSPPQRIADGYEQFGKLLGTIEMVDGPVELDDLTASRTHRWTTGSTLAELARTEVTAHLGPRFAFAFPDGTVRRLYLTPDGLIGSA